MKNAKGFFKYCLRLFDYFDVVFTFRIKDKYSYQSSFGGLIFLIFLFSFIAYFFYNFLNFWNRQNYTMSYFNTVLTPAPQINFYQSGMNIAYALQFENITNQNISIYEFLDTNVYITKIIDSNKSSKIRSHLNSKRCTKDDFFYKINNRTFENLNLFQFWCPDMQSDTIIQGTFTDKLYQFIEVEISLKESTFSNDTNMKFSLEFVKELMLKNPIKVLLYWTDTSVDIRNFYNPISSYLNTFVTYVDFKSIRKINLDFSLIMFNSDSNIFVHENNYKKNISYSDIQEYSLICDDRVSLNAVRTNLVQIFFRSSSKNTIIDMRYQKLNGFLANLGGLMSNILLFLFILVRFINNFRSEQRLMNNIFRYNEHFRIFHPLHVNLMKDHIKAKLKDDVINDNISVFRVEEPKLNNESFHQEFFEFPQDISPRDHKLKNIYNSTDKSSLEMTDKKDVNIRIDVNVENNERKIVKRGMKLESKIVKSGMKLERKITLMEEDDELILSKSIKPLNFTSIEIILKILRCKNKSIALKSKLYKRANLKTQYYLDIYTYIKKIQEIDLLKYLLLDEDQGKLFKFLSKPSINLSQFIQENLYENIHKNELIKSKLEYQEIKDVIASHYNLNKRSDEMSKRLIKYFDYEVENLVCK